MGVAGQRLVMLAAGEPQSPGFQEEAQADCASIKAEEAQQQDQGKQGLGACCPAVPTHPAEHTRLHQSPWSGRPRVTASLSHELHGGRGWVFNS